MVVISTIIKGWGGIMGVLLRRAFVVVVLVSSVVAPAAAQQLSTGQTVTDPAITSWLSARSLDVSEVIVQTGVLNYAGPACPGLGWDCAPEGVPVIQAGLTNQFDCSTSPCVVNQTSNGDNNIANCTQSASSASSSLSCDVTQSNTTGSNIINVSQSASNTIIVSQSVTQDTTLSVTCSQNNGSGSNTLTSTQSADQSATGNLDLPVTHRQDAHASLTCGQTSTTGAQQASVTQSQDSLSDLIATQITQLQNSAVGGPNLASNVNQRSDSGAQSVTVAQDQHLDERATSALGPIAQVQGPASNGQLSADSGGGLSSLVDVDSPSGTSTYSVHQAKDWDQDATTVGNLSQIQDDRIICCLGLEAVSETPDNAAIEHRSDIAASSPGALQRVVHDVKCAAKINCAYSSTINFNGANNAPKTQSGHYITSGRTCTDNTCGDPQAGNPSVLRTEVRCCGAVDYTKETTAPSGAQVGGLFTYQNFSDAPASNIEITFKVPAGMTLVKASGCNYGSTKPGTLIRCKKGTGESGGIRAVDILLKVAGGTPSGTTITLTGTVMTDQSSVPVSSSATIHVS